MRQEILDQIKATSSHVNNTITKLNEDLEPASCGGKKSEYLKRFLVPGDSSPCSRKAP